MLINGFNGGGNSSAQPSLVHVVDSKIQSLDWIGKVANETKPSRVQPSPAQPSNDDSINFIAETTRNEIVENRVNSIDDKTIPNEALALKPCLGLLLVVSFYSFF